MRQFLLIAAMTVVAAAAALTPPAAGAHEQRAAGPVELVVGWGTEPAYAGYINSVSVDVRRDGAAVRGADLDVVVAFGDRNATTKSPRMTLEPGEQAGRYSATIVPNRPGTYTFHVTGTVDGAQIDQFFTSGDKTFDDIKDPVAVAFPAKDPSGAQLVSRVDRADAKVRSVQSASSRSTIALVLGGLGVALALVALLIGRR